MLVSICVITYKRPQGLRRLLEGINQLSFTQSSTPEVEVIVVDNDDQGLANRICAEIEPRFRWQLKTGFEPKRGIAFARNKSIALASKQADFIAIIDDDEVPDPSWLEDLLSTAYKYNSDIVTGPVVPYFPHHNSSSWVVQGNFFSAASYKTGEQRTVAFTHNVLVRASILRKLNPVFDNRLALIGSSDAYLFMNLYKEGYKITWSNEAVVREWIPRSRTNLKWILLRGYRTWSDHSSFEKELYPSLLVQSIRVLKGCALILIGLLGLIPSLLMGKARIVRSLLFAFRGVGTLGGLLDLHYQEYKNVTQE